MSLGVFVRSVGAARWVAVLGALAAVAVPSAAFAAEPPSAASPEAALVLAQQLGVPVVVESSLSRTERDWVAPDGTQSAEISAGPVREADPTTATGWVPVDTTLANVAGAVVPAVTDVPVTFSDGGTDGFLAKIGLGSSVLSLDWLRSLPSPTLER